MESILIDHAQRYPEWEVKDLYKLIHQAVMGSEHAVIDEAGARNWLSQEITHLEYAPDEPLLDPISPDQQIVRVHLRPFVAHQLQTEPLLQAFIGTARAFRPSTEKLIEYAACAIQLARERKLPFKESQVSEYFDQMRTAQFPATNHSNKYEKFYHPAYRVVAWNLLPKEITEVVDNTD
jgi:hypothetical protein